MQTEYVLLQLLIFFTTWVDKHSYCEQKVMYELDRDRCPFMGGDYVM